MTIHASRTHERLFDLLLLPNITRNKKSDTGRYKDDIFEEHHDIVPGRGLEPPRPCGLIHLKDKCLPVSTPGHKNKDQYT